MGERLASWGVLTEGTPVRARVQLIMWLLVENDMAVREPQTSDQKKENCRVFKLSATVDRTAKHPAVEL